MKKQQNQGFTLIEILLAVAALVILAGIVILAINPSKQLADTRNSKRQVDVNSILNAVYQYAIDNNGAIIASIPTGTGFTSSTEICSTGTCGGLIDLTPLTTNEKYLVAIPVDPIATATNHSGYHIYKSANGRISVGAPDTENGKPTISVTR
jgi:type IV pilus assembly protein PilA